MFRAIPVAVAGVPDEKKAKKVPKETKMREKEKTREEKVKKEKKEKANKLKDRCGECAGCLTPNCEECDGCMGRQVGRKQRCERRICLNMSSAKKEKTSSRAKRRRRSSSPEIFINPDLEGDRHCYGMQFPCTFNYYTL